MYFDSRPCDVCGSEVRLRPARAGDGVTEPDGTVDERVCTNRACPTNQGDSSED